MSYICNYKKITTILKYTYYNNIFKKNIDKSDIKKSNKRNTMGEFARRGHWPAGLLDKVTIKASL
jgi:hypothetical protein